MKGDIEIKDDLYNVLKGTLLVAEAGGVTHLRKTQRPAESRNIDVVISVMTNDRYARQEATCWVRIYVPDIRREGAWEEDSVRLRELERLAAAELDRINGGDWRCTLRSMTTVRSDENEHVIACKLLYVQVYDL